MEEWNPRALKTWNYIHFGIAQQQIKFMEQELENIQAQEPGDQFKQEEVEKELKIQRDKLELIFKQKSREVWLKEGDRNTRFFHASIIARRIRNEILEVQVNGDRIQSKQETENYFIQEFLELYSSTSLELPQSFENLIPRNVSEEENEGLAKTPTLEEIK